MKTGPRHAELYGNAKRRSAVCMTYHIAVSSTARPPTNTQTLQHSRQVLFDCSMGRLSLARTICLCAVSTAFALCALDLANDILVGSSLRYQARQGLVMLVSLLEFAIKIWWGQCVLRACIRRTGEGKSVLVSAAVFGVALYCTLSQMSSFGKFTSAAAENWYDDHRQSMIPLQVWADSTLGRIVVEGDVTHDGWLLFEKVVLSNPGITVVELDSRGGYVGEALHMARLIRARGLDTVSFGRCASACTLMFAAGRNRYLGPNAKFGFHRSGYAGMPKSLQLDELDQEMASFYHAMGVGPEIATGGLATPHHMVWRPSQHELFAAKFATLRWSDRPPGM